MPSESWQQDVAEFRNAEVPINRNQYKRRWQFITTFAHNTEKSFPWISLRCLIMFRLEDDLMARAGDESFDGKKVLPGKRPSRGRRHKPLISIREKHKFIGSSHDDQFCLLSRKARASLPRRRLLFLLFLIIALTPVNIIKWRQP
jgi:hypothetical protein